MRSLWFLVAAVWFLAACCSYAPLRPATSPELCYEVTIQGFGASSDADISSAVRAWHDAGVPIYERGHYPRPDCTELHVRFPTPADRAHVDEETVHSGDLHRIVGFAEIGWREAYIFTDRLWEESWRHCYLFDCDTSALYHSQVRGTAVHELGHLLGLRHSPSDGPPSYMKPYANEWPWAGPIPEVDARRAR